MLSVLYGPALTSIRAYWKNHTLTIRTFVSKVMSLLFNMLFYMCFFPRSKHLLISWLQSPFSAILDPKKIKSVTVSISPTSICNEVMRLQAIIFIFERCVLSQPFLSSLSPSSRLLSSSSLPAIRWSHLHI